MLRGTEEISVTITLSREYVVTGDAATIARLAGMDLHELTAVVEDGDDWEPEESMLATMAESPEADLHSEEWDWTEIN